MFYWFNLLGGLGEGSGREGPGLPFLNVRQFEINEAFAAVASANMHILGVTGDRVNVKRGVVCWVIALVPREPAS